VLKGPLDYGDSSRVGAVWKADQSIAGSKIRTRTRGDINVKKQEGHRSSGSKEGRKSCSTDRKKKKKKKKKKKRSLIQSRVAPMADAAITVKNYTTGETSGVYY